MQGQADSIRAVCSEQLASCLSSHLDQFSDNVRDLTLASSLRVLTLGDGGGEPDQQDCEMAETDHSLRNLDRRGTVDVINGLLENFPAGEQCLKLIWQKGKILNTRTVV
jgi:hypothetical protein